MPTFKFRVPVKGDMIIETQADTEEEAWDWLLDEMPTEDDYEMHEWDYTRADCERVG